MSVLGRCTDGYCASQPACPRGTCRRAEHEEVANGSKEDRLSRQYAGAVAALEQIATGPNDQADKMIAQHALNELHGQ